MQVARQGEARGEEKFWSERKREGEERKESNGRTHRMEDQLRQVVGGPPRHRAP